MDRRKARYLLERFELVERAGAGGMGVVHRGIDHATGKSVAIKVMREDVGSLERFSQEASVLASLGHPAIVRYLAHGKTFDEQPFIVMEWVEGRSLEERLAKGPLSVCETIDLGIRLAGALVAAHDRRVVHRDLKPSNIVLPDDDPKLAKLLDFGVARRLDVLPMTRTGWIIGSVGYMAPEQASGERSVDGRADLFSLGCVLFECLTGRAAFSGTHGLAVLAKVLKEPAASVRAMSPEVDEALDALVARLLEKRKDDRPESAEEVLSALSTLARPKAPPGASSDGAGTPRLAARPLRDSEQRVVSALLLELERPGVLADTMVPEQVEQQAQRAFEIARAFGGETTLLGNDVMLSTHVAASPAGQVTSATACALELAAAFPTSVIAVATGRASDSGVVALGPVLDRAASLLDRASGGARIALDEVTARLAESRFDVVADGEAYRLRGRRPRVDTPRLLLGKPTPLVGRRKELALLVATLEECVEECVARVVVVLGHAGAGKSRLRQEFSRSIRTPTPAKVLFASGDPVAAGGAPRLAVDLVRCAAGVTVTADPSSARTELSRYLRQLLSGDELVRAEEFLGELIQVETTDEPSVPLGAARNDPHLMAEWLERTFAGWLRAECERQPLVVVLDDLHWADAATIRYVDAALRLAKDLPLMVLALGRPEVDELFVDLWRQSAPARVHLERISPQAGARLVRAALGEDTARETVARLVERSDGNPFYLEELIRRYAREGSGEFPESVLAVVQARLERLEPDARKLLRGGSVFGERFDEAGLAHVVGRPREEVADWLPTLVDRELIVERSSRSVSGEFAFAHALIHDAAYAMLTEEDRRLGHALAGEWLEQTRSPDPVVLAMHFERAGAPQRELGWLVQAARSVTATGNLQAADRLVERALRLGAEGDVRGVLLALRGQLLAYQGDMQAGRDLSIEAFGLLPVGSDDWFMSAGTTVTTETFLGLMERSPEVVIALANPGLPLRATGPCGYAMGLVFAGLTLGGQTAMAQTCLARMGQVEIPEKHADAIFEAWLRMCRCWDEMFRGHDLGRAWSAALEAIGYFDLAGESLGKIQALYARCELLTQFGCFDEAEATAEQARQLSLRVGSQYFAEMVGFARGQWRAMVASPEEIEAVATPVLELKTSLISTAARVQLAEAAHRRGTLARARELAADALERCVLPDVNVAMARAVLARVALTEGNPSEALDHAERGLPLEASWFRDHTALRLLRAQALRALCRDAAADVALAEARHRLTRAADGLPPEFRASFLRNVPDNARTLG